MTRGFKIVITALIGTLAFSAWKLWESESALTASAEVRRWQCAHWCLFRAARLLGHPITPDEVESLLPVDGDGHSLLQLKESLQVLGTQVTAVKIGFDRFPEGPFPAIVHLNGPDHFVVATRDDGGRIAVFDGVNERRLLPLRSLEKRWSGYVLQMSGDRNVNSAVSGSKPQSPGVPSLEFSYLDLDLADVAPSRKIVSFTFPFVNKGTAQLSITRVETACSCLKATYPSESIPPAGHGVIELQFQVTSAAADGSFQHLATVVSNDPLHPRLNLRASGNRDSSLLVLPDRISFPDQSAETEFRDVVLRYQGTQSQGFEIKSVELDLIGGTAVVLPTKEFIEAEESRIDITWEQRSEDELKVVRITYAPNETLFPESRRLLGTWTIMTSVPQFEAIKVPIYRGAAGVKHVGVLHARIV